MKYLVIGFLCLVSTFSFSAVQYKHDCDEIDKIYSDYKKNNQKIIFEEINTPGDFTKKCFDIIFSVNGDSHDDFIKEVKRQFKSNRKLLNLILAQVYKALTEAEMNAPNGDSKVETMSYSIAFRNNKAYAVIEIAYDDQMFCFSNYFVGTSTESLGFSLFLAL